MITKLHCYCGYIGTARINPKLNIISCPECKMNEKLVKCTVKVKIEDDVKKEKK